MVQMVNIMLCVFSPNKVSICKSKHIHWLWLYILSIIPTGRHNWPVTWNKIPEKRQTVASCASDELTSLPISFTAYLPAYLLHSSLLHKGIKTWVSLDGSRESGKQGWRGRSYHELAKQRLILFPLSLSPQIVKMASSEVSFLPAIVLRAFIFINTRNYNKAL